MGRPRLDNESLLLRHRRVIELSRRGVPVADIATVMGMTTTSVFRIRQRYGLSHRPPPRRWTPDELSLAEELLAGGASCAEVARTLGRQPSVVRRRFPQYRWTPQQRAEQGVLALAAKKLGQL